MEISGTTANDGVEPESQTTGRTHVLPEQETGADSRRLPRGLRSGCLCRGEGRCPYHATGPCTSIVRLGSRKLNRALLVEGTSRGRAISFGQRIRLSSLFAQLQIQRSQSSQMYSLNRSTDSRKKAEAAAAAAALAMAPQLRELPDSVVQLLATHV